MATVPLKEVDRVEILSVMDNSIDVLMGNTPVAKRHKRGSNAHARPQLRAESTTNRFMRGDDTGAPGWDLSRALLQSGGACRVLEQAVRGGPIE
jgi:hypothetical protein